MGLGVGAQDLTAGFLVEKDWKRRFGVWSLGFEGLRSGIESKCLTERVREGLGFRV